VTSSLGSTTTAFFVNVFQQRKIQTFMQSSIRFKKTYLTARDQKQNISADSNNLSFKKDLKILLLYAKAMSLKNFSGYSLILINLMRVNFSFDI